MALPTRAYWKGVLCLSLVSIRIEVHTGVDTASEISFRQIHKPSGRRVDYEKMVPGVGPIENEDIVKGFEVGKDQYLVIEPEEVKGDFDSSQLVDIVEFVEAKQCDARFYERPYILLPGDKYSVDGYNVVVKALKETGCVGLTQITMGGRESLACVSPVGDGLILEPPRVLVLERAGMPS